jgi:hypothetical protein
MKDFRLAAQNVNVMFNFYKSLKSEILMSDKFVSFITSCTLCTAVEADGLGITERTTTILNI